MGEILSQKDIDSLLSAIQAGNLNVDANKSEVKKDDRIIKNYDFRRPNKFSKDQLNTIEFIYEDFSRSLKTLLSGLLRIRVETKLDFVSEFTYDEFVQTIPNPTILNVFSLPPLDGKGILEINPTIAFSIIDRLFGGPGFSTNVGRALTEIEKNVIQRVVEKILVLFKEAWSICFEINPTLEVIENNPQFAQVVSLQEMVIVITIHITIGEVEDLINICLPCLMLEPMANKLNTKFWFASASASSKKDHSKYLQQVVDGTEIPLSVVLGNNSITIKELLELQKGDVIPLDKKKDKDAEVFIDSELRFYGQIGKIGNNLAIRINKTCHEGSD